MSITVFPSQLMPEWLECPDAERLPIRAILSGSVYYPACGIDGGPIKHFAKYFPSFVYTDYGYERAAVLQNLDEFIGYKVAFVRDVTIDELGVDDLDLLRANPPNNPHTFQLPETSWFCCWAVFERKDDYGDEHGPRRFSLLYSNSDGIAFFKSVYWKQDVAPAMIAIIQPGTGFGGNWTNFEDENGPLASAVLGNPSGNPMYLLNGGWGDGEMYREPCWSTYSKRVAVIHGRLRCWGRTLAT